MKTIKNIGIFAHVDAGKTTLTEQLLYQTGAIRHLGRVDHGDTVTDENVLERERGISIFASPTSYTFEGHKVNIIDTPGHVDFIAEVERSMLVLDGAVLVISAKEKVQSHTRLLFRTLQRLKVPTLIVINKIDRLGVIIDDVLKEIHAHLTEHAIVLQKAAIHFDGTCHVEDEPIQINDANIEKLSLVDEHLLVDYLDDKRIDQQRMEQTLQIGTERVKCFPVCFASALKGLGVRAILHHINRFLPAFQPLETDEPSGVVFRINRRPGTVTKLATIKLEAGRLKAYDYIGGDKITTIKKYEAGRLVAVGQLEPGEIAVVTGLNHIGVGHVFGKSRIHDIHLGQPTLRAKIRIEQMTYREKLLQALSNIQDADPYLSYELSDYTKDIHINMFGYVQMEILEELLARDYQLKVHFEKPKVIFKEAPIKVGQGFMAIRDPMNPFEAGIRLKISPMPSGSGITCVSEVSFGSLQRPYQNAVWDGVKKHLAQGLYGWQITDIQVTLVDYEYNSVTSTPSDYRLLSPIVLFRALKEAGTKLLWPINRYELQVKTRLMGRAMSDLQAMLAVLEEPSIKEDRCIITGEIPAQTSGRYDLSVQEYTSGLGDYTAKHSHYEPAPDTMVEYRDYFMADPGNMTRYIMEKQRTI